MHYRSDRFLHARASITYAESLASKRVIANIRETGVTIMMGVPLLYEKMINGINRAISEKPFHLRVQFKSMMGMVKGVRKMTRRNYGQKVFRSLRVKAGLGTLRLLISGGAPLSP
jgi:long-chain acyl-CoA synthetase